MRRSNYGRRNGATIKMKSGKRGAMYLTVDAKAFSMNDFKDLERLGDLADRLRNIHQWQTKVYLHKQQKARDERLKKKFENAPPKPRVEA